MTMLSSLAFIFLFGLAVGAVFSFLKLPRIIGMLLTGIVLGPYALDLLDPSILSISADLRKIALIVILLKAGLSLNLDDLKRVGRPAVMMSFLPASFEIAAFVLFAPFILHLTYIESAVMGAVLAAVSPAVVVPRMVQLMETGWGTKKSIPQLVLAGASCDDIFVIVLFTTFSGMAQGGSASFADFASVPLSIVLGIALGGAIGALLGHFFELSYSHGHKIRGSIKVIILLGISFLLVCVEDAIKPRIPMSGLLASVSMTCSLKLNIPKNVTKSLSDKFGRLWIAAEVVLFVLVGAAVDIRYTLSAGLASVLMLLIALTFRAVGVLVCMAGTKLSPRERLFCIIAYLPKATVQAAIGSVPLAMGLACGKIVLSVAVLAILITAPLGAMGIDLSYKKLLTQNKQSE